MFDFDDLPDVEAAATDTSGVMFAPKTALVPRPLGRKIRVLGLHGGGSNTNIMQFQAMQLKKHLGDRAEWDFINGGRMWMFEKGMEPPEMLKAIGKDMPFYGWYGVSNDDPSDRDYHDKLFDLSVTFTYAEVEAGVERVMNHIQTKGPFDVVVGFSQGCIVSHLVLGLLRERGEPIPWRISILFNGMRVRDQRFAELFKQPLDHPAVMVFGRKDEFYDYGKASQLDMYENPVVLEHDEGHKFPTQRPQAQEVYAEVVKQVLWHCGVESE